MPWTAAQLGAVKNAQQDNTDIREHFTTEYTYITSEYAHDAKSN